MPFPRYNDLTREMNQYHIYLNSLRVNIKKRSCDFLDETNTGTQADECFIYCFSIVINDILICSVPSYAYIFQQLVCNRPPPWVQSVFVPVLVSLSCFSTTHATSQRLKATFLTPRASSQFSPSLPLLDCKSPTAISKKWQLQSASTVPRRPAPVSGRASNV